MGDEPAVAEAHDDTVPRVARWIAVFSCVFAIVSRTVADTRTALSVLVGGAIIGTNLFVLARVIRATTGPARSAMIWVFVYVAKLGALFGGTYVLIHGDYVSAIGVGGGFAALLPAVVVVALLPTVGDGQR